MTAPDGGTPEGSLGVGLFHALQTKSVDDAKDAMSGGVVGAFEGLQDTAHDEYNTPISLKPDVEEVPIDSTMWHTMTPKEQASFPRANLVKLVNSATASGGSGTTAHTHSISQFASIPDYQPSGNGSDYLELAFIRITKDVSFTHAGFITGDNATFLDVTGAYVGVFRMNSSTGNLTLLNTSTAGTNIKSFITNKNTEHIFSLGGTFSAAQNEVIAVGVLQDTTSIQTAASLMCTRITDLSRDSGGIYPRKAYAYAGTYSSIPSSITESALNYSASTKLPFFYLREV